ncbi:hypothetical protein ACPTKN_14595, partial [Enterococcus faecalis]|uniref:hypothetical protein n=1 Tax=Enterococcus faecalis TaxID=1351 RepID=UPI003CC6D338
MDKSFLVYDREFVLGICKECSNDWLKKRFTIPSDVFGGGTNSIVRHYVKKQLKVILEECSDPKKLDFFRSGETHSVFCCFYYH